MRRLDNEDMKQTVEEEASKLGGNHEILIELNEGWIKELAVGDIIQLDEAEIIHIDTGKTTELNEKEVAAQPDKEEVITSLDNQEEIAQPNEEKTQSDIEKITQQYKDEAMRHPDSLDGLGQTINPSSLLTPKINIISNIILEDACTAKNNKTVTSEAEVESLNKSFEKHLKYPEPLKKSSSDTKIKEKLPSAISSKAWRDYYLKKENVKKEKEEAVLKRKEERKTKQLSKKTAKYKSDKKNNDDDTKTQKKENCGIRAEELISDDEADKKK